MARTRKNKDEQYFGPNEEQAVIRFLESTDEKERNQIFNEWLIAPLNKMIESIIRRYKLYRKGFTFEEIHADTLSFLMTKAHRFENSKGTKAYSYFGTICKHYLLGLLMKDDKYLKATASYDDYFEDLEEREDLTYKIDDEDFVIESFIGTVITGIKEEVERQPLINEKPITENETKVGMALIDLLENWGSIMDFMSGGVKYNKNSIIDTIRNYTNLTTKEIRISMKRYKILYFLIKNEALEE